MRWTQWAGVHSERGLTWSRFELLQTKCVNFYSSCGGKTPCDLIKDRTLKVESAARLTYKLTKVLLYNSAKPISICMTWPQKQTEYNVLIRLIWSFFFVCRRSLNEMQRRHLSQGGNPHGGGPSLVGRGTACYNLTSHTNLIPSFLLYSLYRTPLWHFDYLDVITG